MKKLILLALLIALPCQAQELARMNPAILGAGVVAAGTTYVYPNNVSTFADTSNSITSTVVVGDTIAGVTQTITKLGFYIADPQSATECSVGIFANTEVPGSSLGGCYFSPASNTWGECTVSYGMSSGTTYTLWGHCNNEYKIKSSTSSCTPYYATEITYVQGMETIEASRFSDTGCNGFRIGY